MLGHFPERFHQAVYDLAPVSASGPTLIPTGTDCTSGKASVLWKAGRRQIIERERTGVDGQGVPSN